MAQPKGYNQACKRDGFSIPFLRRFNQKIDENGDEDRKSGLKCIPLQAWL